MADINPSYPVREMTQAQYNALTEKDNGTLYCITDTPNYQASCDRFLETRLMTMKTFEALPVFEDDVLYCIKNGYDETKIALIRLDENDDLTENIMYYEDTDEVYGALYGGGSDRYKMRCGVEVPTENLDRRLLGVNKLRIVEILTPITQFSSSSYFYNCINLKSVSLPSSLESVGSNVFLKCTSLETITIAKPENSISGVPWGAPNAAVTWTG